MEKQESGVEGRSSETGAGRELHSRGAGRPPSQRGGLSSRLHLWVILAAVRFLNCEQKRPVEPSRTMDRVSLYLHPGRAVCDAEDGSFHIIHS